MQQFVVPQFIDVEDKVIGPITVRQFVILLVGSGLIFAAYKLSDFALFLFFFVVLSFLTFGFAFIRINGRPVHYLLLNIFQTLRRPKLKVWRKIFLPPSGKKKNKEATTLPAIITSRNNVRASRLAELSLIVDTGGIYQGEANNASLGQELL